MLISGEKINLTNQYRESCDKILYIDYNRLINDLKFNDIVLIDDGKIKLKVNKISKDINNL